MAVMATTTSATRYPDNNSNRTPYLQLKERGRSHCTPNQPVSCAKDQARGFFTHPSTMITTTLSRDSGMLVTHPRGRTKIWTSVCVLPKLQWALPKPGVSSHSNSPVNWLHHPTHSILIFHSAPNETLDSDGCDRPVVFCKCVSLPSCLQYSCLCTVQSILSFLAYPLLSVLQSPSGEWKGHRLWSPADWALPLSVWV